ncbi:hypothetical protein A5621_23270 [Mycobacterium colombiense]|nr:hypothetical protein A5621_23270 [Mycobacterium colombiense]
MRPMPASRFQLTPQPGTATAIFCSALRYAASAMLGMPSAPGALTIIAGGGADSAGSATWKTVGPRSTGTTAGPVRSGRVGETAATGVTAACRDGIRTGSEGAAALTAPAKTSGVIIATPKIGLRVFRSARCRSVAAAGLSPRLPPMRTRPS